MLLLELLQQVVPLCSSNDFVIDVCDIHDIQDAVSKVVFQDASDYVKGDIVSRMPHVGAVVYCWSTLIPRQLFASWPSNWNKRLFAILQAVVDLWEWYCRPYCCVKAFRSTPVPLRVSHLPLSAWQNRPSVRLGFADDYIAYVSCDAR